MLRRTVVIPSDQSRLASAGSLLGTDGLGRDYGGSIFAVDRRGETARDTTPVLSAISPRCVRAQVESP